MGPHFAEEITVEKKADATYKVVGAGEWGAVLRGMVYVIVVHICRYVVFSDMHGPGLVT